MREIAARRAANFFWKIEGIEEIFQRQRRGGIEEAQKKKTIAGTNRVDL